MRAMIRLIFSSRFASVSLGVRRSSMSANLLMVVTGDAGAGASSTAVRGDGPRDLTEGCEPGRGGAATAGDVLRGGAAGRSGCGFVFPR
jgi:hypothetical protein